MTRSGTRLCRHNTFGCRGVVPSPRHAFVGPEGASVGRVLFGRRALLMVGKDAG